jgi:hypothetical protein
MNRLGLILVVALVAACNNSPTAQLGPVAYVTIFPAAKVIQVGATFPLSPTLTDANNNALSGRVVTWSSNTPAVATVDNSSGIVTGVASGSATITATSEGKTGTSAITVPGPATKLKFTVQPSGATSDSPIAPAVQVSALDAQGNLAGSFTGSVTVALISHPSGGTLSGTTTVAAVAGVAEFTTLSIDQATVDTLHDVLTAAATGLTGATSAAFTVSSASPVSIVVTPNPATLPANVTQQFTAVGKDARGNDVAISATWSVRAGGGTIDGVTGLFTSGTVAGTFTKTVVAQYKASATVTFKDSATVIVPGPSAGPAAVALGTAGNYVILAKSGISNVPTSAITGNLGLSPATATAITGFALTLDATGTFSTSAQVTGNVYAADYTAPTPLTLTTAVNDMVTAYNDAAGRSNPDYTELAAGDIGGLTLPPGLYKWSNTVLIPADVTLEGSATDVWIFQIAGGLTQSSATNVILTGGALAQNVFWQVSGVVDVGTNADLEGEVLSLTQIKLETGAVAHGRLLAQTRVTLDHNIVVQK